MMAHIEERDDLGFEKVKLPLDTMLKYVNVNKEKNNNNIFLRRKIYEKSSFIYHLRNS
ncbi:MAG: hypothetical protein IPH11_07000 [Ignavibacteriales bacterium]|nr:hypothetical protein [Ignavibacteriales bacterium]